MITMVFLCRRREDVEHGAYADMVLRDHVPLALRHHPTMRGYVVDVVEQSPPGWPELDSVALLRFDDFETFRDRLYDSPEGRAAIERDVRRFLGHAAAYVTRAYVQRPGDDAAPLGTRTPRVTFFCPLRRRDGLSHEAFVEHWLTRHVPLALRHHAGLVRYVTNVVERPLGDAEPWDGFAELGFAPSEVLGGVPFESDESETIIRDDVARFVGTTAAYRVAEYVQKR